MAKNAEVESSYSGRIRATKIFRTIICVLLCIISMGRIADALIGKYDGSKQLRKKGRERQICVLLPQSTVRR